MRRRYDRSLILVVSFCTAQNAHVICATLRLFATPSLYTQQVEQLIRDGKDLQDHEDAGKKSFFGGQKKKVNKFGEKVAELEDRYAFARGF